MTESRQWAIWSIFQRRSPLPGLPSVGLCSAVLFKDDALIPFNSVFTEVLHKCSPGSSSTHLGHIHSSVTDILQTFICSWVPPPSGFHIKASLVVVWRTHKAICKTPLLQILSKIDILYECKKAKKGKILQIIYIEIKQFHVKPWSTQWNTTGTVQNTAGETIIPIWW